MSLNTLPNTLEHGQLPARSSYRWTICVLLFLATTINYMDRQVLGILAPELKEQFKWDDLQYSYIVIAFQSAYAIGLLSFGWLIDRWGTRKGYSLSILIWSLAAAAHALARSAFGFGVARFALGFGEAGNFPAAIKTIAEWFPKRERALATGLFNSGSNVERILAPAIVPAIALYLNWQAAFIILGIAGLLWIGLWLALYERPEKSRRLSAGELKLIRSDNEGSVDDIGSGKLRWRELVRFRQTWAYVVPSAIVNPIWWFYLYWLPMFFAKQYGLDLKNLGLPLVVVYTMALLGSIAGGWLSSKLLKLGWSLNASRKTALATFAGLVVPVAFITHAPGVWLAVALAGLAMAGHQGLSANMYTMASDLFPKRAVASVVGLGTACGSVTAIVFSLVVGKTLSSTGSYAIPFLVAGIGYPLVIAFIQLMEPRWTPVEAVVLPQMDTDAHR